MMCDFSIVIPTYNASSFIEETINSILSQDYKSFEVIVIDDGSTDDTYEKLKKYKDKIILEQQNNLGDTEARNRGIQLAKGKYVVSFDHDDILLPFALKVYASVINKFHNPPIINATLYPFKKLLDVNSPEFEYESIQCRKMNSFFKKNIPLTFYNSNIVIRTDLLKKINGYPNNSFAYSDYRLIFRIGDSTPFVAITKPATIGYRIHSSNNSSNPDFLIDGFIALVNDERKGKLAGGFKYKVDRRGLIATNGISLFLQNQYSAIRNFKYISKVFLNLRTMLFWGIFRIIASRYYNSETASFKILGNEN